jgi:hypothetical protein
MNVYCPNCGFKSPSTGITVKFCSGCGYSFISGTLPGSVSTTSEPKKLKKTNKPTKYHKEEEDEDGDEYEFSEELPKLNPANISIGGYTNRDRFKKIGELGAAPEIEGRRVAVAPKLSKEEFKQQWYKENSSSRNSIEIGE